MALAVYNPTDLTADELAAAARRLTESRRRNPTDAGRPDDLVNAERAGRRWAAEAAGYHQLAALMLLSDAAGPDAVFGPHDTLGAVDQAVQAAGLPVNSYTVSAFVDGARLTWDAVRDRLPSPAGRGNAGDSDPEP